MESFYEINVSESVRGIRGGQYRHLFATAPRSLTDPVKAKSVATTMREKFPTPRYVVELTHFSVAGSRLSI